MYTKHYFRKVFVDMDQVLADFDAAQVESGLPAERFKLLQGSYRHLGEMPEALESLDWIQALGFEVFLATKIPTLNPYAATEKLLWVQERRPKLLERTIITPHKGLLGCKYDKLVDDRPHKANCHEFEGTLLTFGPENDFPDWATVRTYLEKVNPVVFLD